MCVTGSAQAEPSELAEGEMTVYLGLEGVGGVLSAVLIEDCDCCMGSLSMPD